MTLTDQHGVKQKIKYLIFQDHYPTGGIWKIATKKVYENYRGARKIEIEPLQHK